MGRYVQRWMRLQGCLPKEWIGMFDAVSFRRNMGGGLHFQLESGWVDGKDAWENQRNNGMASLQGEN